MDLQSVPVIVGVRFSKVGKIYHFDASHVADLQLGDAVVVETSRGWQIGSVAQLLPTPESIPEGLKAIDRRATPRDLVMRQSWQSKEADVVTAAKTRARELNLAIKVVGAEYSFDGTRLAILFSTETEDKVELRSLRPDMQRTFSPAQVEMRQIGPRDVAKLLCGMGACGLEQRCCSQFLCEFSSISIRMAKEQGISLTPSEITGMCGRLRCCLIYEYQQYVDARAQLPKRNKIVMTPHGEGRVIDQAPMRDAAVVEFPDGMRREVPREQLTVLDGTTPAPSIAPVDRPISPVESTPADSEVEAPEQFTSQRQNAQPAAGQRSESRPAGQQAPGSRQQRPQRGGNRSREGNPPRQESGASSEEAKPQDRNQGNRSGRPQGGRGQPGGPTNQAGDMRNRRPDRSNPNQRNQPPRQNGEPTEGGTSTEENRNPDNRQGSSRRRNRRPPKP